MLHPLHALIDDTAAWQQQADGLAIFTTPTEHHFFRTPIALTEEVVIGDRFRLRPLLHLVDNDAFFVVALAQNSVRVFEATTQTIAELSNEHLPTSIDDALRLEDPERQLQSQSVGGGDVRFHGHGAGKELEKQTLARYFQAVDRGLVALIGPTALPVIIACVDYYLPIYREITNLSNVFDTAVSGNPEHRSAAELHAAALTLIQPDQRHRTTAMTEHFNELKGTGHTLTDLPTIAEAASQGRIETLLVAIDEPSSLTSTTLTQIDNVIADVITTGATVAVAPPSLIEGPLAAILRY